MHASHGTRTIPSRVLLTFRNAGLVAAAVLGISAAPAHGAGLQGAAAPPSDAGPKEVVRGATERLLAALERDREGYVNDPDRAYRLVDEVASPHVDYERISARTLGAHWRRATASQRARIEPAIRALLLRSFSSAVATFEGTEVQFLPVAYSKTGKRAKVRTRVPVSGGQSLSLDFRMHRTRGTWKIYDVVADGVSLVLTYRNTFVAEAKRVGIDAFIDRLANESRPPARGS